MIMSVLKRYCFIIVSGLLAFCVVLPVNAGDSQADLNVLVKDSSQSQQDEMMRQYLRRLSHEAYAKRHEKYEALKTKEQIEAYQKEMRAFFIEQLDLPEKTPLNPEIVVQKTYADYRLEKIIYESQPGFYVPALLYLPLTEPPYPGVLVVQGHGDAGKADDKYQILGVNLAKNGMAALFPDPLCQGERKQVLDETGKPLYRATTEHQIAGVAPILLGQCLATYMIWDGIRGIDYLVSRPDIDATKIGCTGVSGGGNRTSYLMALDERIVCAAPGCFITTKRLKNDGKGPGDAEQNIHSQIAYGMDHADYILMRAPKPTLILSATQDFVPIQGAWESFREAKRIYTRLGNPEKVDLTETDEQHGYALDLRVSMIRWMRRWLLDKHEPVVEKPCSILSAEELYCTPKGQILLMENSKSVYDLYREKARDLVDSQAIHSDKQNVDELRTMIRGITGIRELKDLPDVSVEIVKTMKHHGYKLQKGMLRWDTDIQLPFLLFYPKNKIQGGCLYLHDQGKYVDAGKKGPMTQFLEDDKLVMAVDLRGLGETSTTPWRYIDAHPFTGHDVAEFHIAYMLGKSFLGMRTEDIFVSARYLQTLIPSGDDLQIVAIGETGPPALHAIALEPEWIDALTLQKTLNSWNYIVQSSITKGALNHVVHDALKFYDLQDLIPLAGKDRISIINPIDAQLKPIQDE